SLSLDYICYFLFNEQASTVIYTLSLHDALPISRHVLEGVAGRRRLHGGFLGGRPGGIARPCPVRRAAFSGGVRRAASCGEIAARRGRERGAADGRCIRARAGIAWGEHAAAHAAARRSG